MEKPKSSRLRSSTRQIWSSWMSRTGAVGILIQAKVQGRIAELRGELDRLRTEGGFWIEDQLYRRAFQAVGEE